MGACGGDSEVVAELPSGGFINSINDNDERLVMVGRDHSFAFGAESFDMTCFGKFSSSEGSELLGQEPHCSAAKRGSETDAYGRESDMDFADGNTCGPLGQEGGFASSCFRNDESDVVCWMNEPLVE